MSEIPKSNWPEIEWNRPKLERFKAACESARRGHLQGGEDSFQFDGHEFVIGYARYLIMYLEGVLK